MGRKVKDQTGRKIGVVTVLDKNEERSINGKTFWNCVCECGQRLIINSSHLCVGSYKKCSDIHNKK
jgi:hypothetical protein